MAVRRRKGEGDATKEPATSKKVVESKPSKAPTFLQTHLGLLCLVFSAGVFAAAFGCK